VIYDLMILGGGPAGYFAAERAADAGFRTILFEERNIGGVCLNEGCIPTKSMLYSAKLAMAAKHSEEYGVYSENARIEQASVIDRKNKVVGRLVRGIASSLKQKQIDAVHAAGVIKGKTENGFLVEADEKIYEGARLLICTGSETIIPKISGMAEAVESGFVLTSREILDLDHVPEHLVIVGGGAIGLEMANYFAVAGSEVTIVEMLPEIGGAIDREIARTLRSNLENLGIRFMLETKAAGVAPGRLRCEGVGHEESIPADKILLSIGRKPRAADAGLENIGIYTEKGAVVTDERMRTNVPMVWAAGDVNGRMMLAHTAYREAAAAVSDMAGAADTMRYDAIPQIIYTQPEAAGVGETEESAAAKGYIAETVKVPLAYSGRYVAENMSGDGFVKVIAEKGTGRILGVHIIGSYASEIILSAAILVASKRTALSASKIVFPHPTVGEAMRDAFLELNKKEGAL